MYIDARPSLGTIKLLDPRSHEYLFVQRGISGREIARDRNLNAGLSMKRVADTYLSLSRSFQAERRGAVLKYFSVIKERCVNLQCDDANLFVSLLEFNRMRLFREYSCISLPWIVSDL